MIREWASKNLFSNGNKLISLTGNLIKQFNWYFNGFLNASKIFGCNLVVLNKIFSVTIIFLFIFIWINLIKQNQIATYI